MYKIENKIKKNIKYLLIFPSGSACLPGFNQIIGEIQSKTMYLETNETESIP